MQSPCLFIPWNLCIQNSSAPISDSQVYRDDPREFENSLLINFEQKADCCAVWSVLRIVPFRGDTLTAAVHWAPIQPEHPGPRIIVERPSKPLALLERK
jgi:hypothetical protein